MKYHTINELDHFCFKEAYIAQICAVNGMFEIVFDNVTILPENSCNRDIREMRANDLVLKIKEPVIRSLVREGYKVYDANGALLRTCEDEVIDQAAWNETIRSFADGTLRTGRTMYLRSTHPMRRSMCLRCPARTIRRPGTVF